MIDLDAIWTEADELYCHLGIAFCLGKMSWQNWRALTSQFAYYQYVLPDDRMLNETLLDTFYASTRKTAAEMMRFVLLIGNLEAHFTEQDQARMLSILITAGSSRKRG